MFFSEFLKNHKSRFVLLSTDFFFDLKQKYMFLDVISRLETKIVSAIIVLL